MAESPSLIDGPLPGMSFAHIPAGEFIMGSPEDEEAREEDEKQHLVTISKGFYMQTTLVTQAQWKALIGTNPFYFEGSDRPVEEVTWNDVQEFIHKLNVLDPGREYRLPTEAEWEYACRAGTTTRFYSGNSRSDLARAGWYCGNSGDETRPVGQKMPNHWGLYDMHGNVFDLCQDKYASDYYEECSPSVTDPQGPVSGSFRVIRGGGWGNFARNCRAADRNCSCYITCGNYGIGFRLVRPE